jgi:hypothetical protein
MQKNQKIFFLGIVLFGTGLSFILGQSQPMAPMIKTQLIPEQKEYVLGQPMKILLRMENLSSETVKYKAEGFDDMLAIDGPDNQPVPFIEWCYMTLAAASTLLPGQSVILTEDWDISSQYLIGSTGRYRIKFVGDTRNNMPPSDTIEIEVKPGNLKPMDVLLDKLVPILPKDWTIAVWLQKKDFTNQVDLGNDIIVNGFLITLVQPNMKYIDHPGIQLLVTDRVIGIDTLKKVKGFDQVEYLGQNSVGHIYWMNADPEALNLWHDAREKISKALIESTGEF